MLRRVSVLLLLCCASAQTALAQQPQTQRQELTTGAEVYQAACAACHGADGRGHPQSVVGFAKPLPDFTDCLFVTVEADEGWEAVVHQGGPVRALDRHMPAFGNALSEHEIRMVVSHLRTFCDEHRKWPQGDLNFPRALITEKAFPENETLITSSFGTGPAGAVSNALLHERRFGSRTMMEFNIPFETQQTESGTWNYGLGDIAIAVKRDLFHSVAHGSILSVGEEVGLPTGKESLGLGSGVTTFESFAAYGQRLPALSFVQFHVGIERFTTGHRQEYGAEDRERVISLGAKEADGVPWIDGAQHLRRLHDPADTEQGDRQEPDDHHRAEQPADAMRAELLHHKQEDQDHHRQRNDVWLEQRRGHVQPFSCTEH